MRSNGVPGLAAATLVVLGCLAGCAAVRSPTSAPTPTATSVVQVVRGHGRILLTHPGVNGDQALLGGALVENAAHCITVHDQVVIWPAGTRLLDDGSVVVLGKTLKAGSTVHIGGGIWAPDPSMPGLCDAPGTRFWGGGSAA